MRELITIPTLGPKKALRLYEDLHISSVSELAAAIEKDALADLKGFGEKTQENIRHGIELLRRAGTRVPLSLALDTAERIVAELSAVTGCTRCAYAGSLRRMRETVGDLDVLVAAERSAPFMDALCELPVTAEVVARGRRRPRCAPARGSRSICGWCRRSRGAPRCSTLTGSKAHNIRTRTIAGHQGLKLSEYGVFDTGSGASVASRTEEEVYARLGLPWIPPTLREDRGRSRRRSARGCRRW